MRYVACGLLPGWTAFALIVGTMARADEDKEVSAARKDVLALAKEVEAGKDITAKAAAAMRKKYEDLNTIAQVYKPRNKRGIGFGPTPVMGIETKIRDLSKRT